MLACATFFALTVQDVESYLGQEVTLTDPAGWTQSGVLVGFTEREALLQKPDGREVQVRLEAYTTVSAATASAGGDAFLVEALTPRRFLLDGRPVGWEKASYYLATDPDSAELVVSADRRTGAGSALLGLGAALIVGGLVTGATEECLYYPGMPAFCYNRWNIGAPLVAVGVASSGAGAGLRLSGLKQRMRAADARGE